ncbi:MAG: DUF3332 family protein [Planctomycetes bacterium]|nr:DUF3332 family protein [Planctomycetota bacterium]
MENGLMWRLRTRRGTARSWVVAILLVTMLPILTGCYGQFPLTKAVYNFNGECSDNKWVRTIVMWVFAILQVYTIATVADAIVFNLVEFWTGQQLMAGSVTAEDGTKYALEPSDDGKQAVLTISRNDRVLTRATFVRVSDSKVEVLDGNGKLTGMVLRSPDGTLHLTDAQGVTIRTLSADEVAKAVGI